MIYSRTKFNSAYQTLHNMYKMKPRHIMLRLARTKCAICVKTLFLQKNKRLRCKHVFHDTCIGIKQCPLCDRDSNSLFHHTLRVFDEELARFVNTFQSRIQLVNIPEELSPPPYHVVYASAPPVDLLPNDLYKQQDPFRLLFSAIVDQDINLVKRYVSCKSINWHKTFRGDTLIDAAYKTNNPLIIELVRPERLCPRLYPMLE
jgi:hypothetical protein